MQKNLFIYNLLFFIFLSSFACGRVKIPPAAISTFEKIIEEVVVLEPKIEAITKEACTDITLAIKVTKSCGSITLPLPQNEQNIDKILHWSGFSNSPKIEMPTPQSEGFGLGCLSAPFLLSELHSLLTKFGNEPSHNLNMVTNIDVIRFIHKKKDDNLMYDSIQNNIMIVNNINDTIKTEMSISVEEFIKVHNVIKNDSNFTTNIVNYGVPCVYESAVNVIQKEKEIDIQVPPWEKIRPVQTILWEKQFAPQDEYFIIKNLNTAKNSEVTIKLKTENNNLYVSVTIPSINNDSIFCVLWLSVSKTKNSEKGNIITRKIDLKKSETNYELIFYLPSLALRKNYCTQLIPVVGIFDKNYKLLSINHKTLILPEVIYDKTYRLWKIGTCRPDSKVSPTIRG